MRIARVRVGDVLRLERMPVVPDPTKEYTSIGVRSFGKGIFHYEPTAGDRLGKLRFFEVQPQRLVVSNIKAWEGAVAVSGRSDIGCIASNRFLTYVPIDDRIDVRWARWFFLSGQGNELLQTASPGSADRNRTLAVSRFENLEIPLPSLDEQRRVAQRLDGVEVATGELGSRVAHADVLSDALGVAMTLRPDLDDAAKKGDGWVYASLSEVLTRSTAAVPVEPGGTYLIAGIYSFGRGLIDRGSILGADTSYATLTRLSGGDVVVSKLNGWEGAVAVVSERFDGYHVSSEYPTFVPDRERLLPSYFAGIARASSFWADLNASARGSMVRRRRINPSEFVSARVWLPPIETQEATTRALATAAQAARSRHVTRTRIDALVPAALNEAFGGLS